MRRGRVKGMGVGEEEGNGGGGRKVMWLQNLDQKA